MLVSGSAAAQGAAGPAEEIKTSLVLLRTPSCAAFAANVDRFVQLLAIELAIARVQLIRDAAVPNAELTLEMDAALCARGARQIGVALVRPTGARADHTIALHDVNESARPRALALAVAELVRTAQSQSETARAASSTEDVTRAPVEQLPSGAPRVQPPDPVDVRSFAAAPAAPGERFVRPVLFGDVQATFASRIFAPESTIGAGASLAVGLPLRLDWLRARADATATWSSIDDPLGNVGVGVYSGGIALLATSGRSPEFQIGPHLEIGAARAVGVAGEPGSHASVQTRAIALLSLTTGARFWFDRWAILVQLDLGAAIAGADVFADDRRVAAIGGAFVGMRAGVAFGY